MKIIMKKYEVRGRVFTVIHDQGHFLAIEDKYLDERGCLKQRLTGLQMYAAADLEVCLAQVRTQVDIDHLIAEGLPRADAFCAVHGIPVTDAIRAVFEQAERRAV